MIAIVNGKEYQAKWFWPHMDKPVVMLEITDNRPLSEIARDFEYALRIEKKSETEGNEIYVDNGRVLSILRPDAAKDNVQITVERGAKLENID